MLTFIPFEQFLTNLLTRRKNFIHFSSRITATTTRSPIFYTTKTRLLFLIYALLPVVPAPRNFPQRKQPKCLHAATTQTSASSFLRHRADTESGLIKPYKRFSCQYLTYILKLPCRIERRLKFVYACN